MSTANLRQRSRGDESLDLADRIHVANSISTDVLSSVERFHRQSALIRRSRLGLDISAYHNKAVYEKVARKQARYSEAKVDVIGLHPALDRAGLRRWGSARAFASGPSLSVETFKKLLFHSFTAGMCGVNSESAPYPSAGAVYAVQAFVAPLVLVDGATFGMSQVLHVASYENSLYRMANSDALEAATVCLDCSPGAVPHSYANAALMIAYVIDLELSTLRYAERGYRFGLIEAGLMSQQASLVGQQFGLASCLFGGFPDAELASALGLNEKKMLPCLVQFFGNASK